MSKFTLIWVLFITAVIFIRDISMKEYCDIKSCSNKGEHVMCKYRKSTYHAACGYTVRVMEGITAGELVDILQVHNDQRALIASGEENRGNPGPQPGAENMEDLMWDESLANIAQRWANQCHDDHDECRDVEEFEVGQNVAYISKTDDYENNMTDIIINQWYCEVDEFSNEWAHKLPKVSTAIQNYTQMVWAETKKIGCGVIRYRDPADDWYVTRLVCNYGPAGNIEGSSLYDIDKEKSSK